MRLSEFPFVVVRVSCTKCPRRGQYRLARLAERYGAEIEMPWLMAKLAEGCPRRVDVHRQVYDACGARFEDIGRGRRPPDMPAAMRPKLKVVDV